MLIFFYGRYEISCTIIVYKHIAITRFNAQWTTGPMELIIPVHRIAIKNSGFGSPVITLLPMAPHDIFACFPAIHKFGTLYKTTIPQRRMRTPVPNDFTFKLPIYKIFCRIHIYIRIPRIVPVFSYHIPRISYLKETGSMGLYDFPPIIFPQCAVTQSHPIGGATIKINLSGLLQTSHSPHQVFPLRYIEHRRHLVYSLPENCFSGKVCLGIQFTRIQKGSFKRSIFYSQPPVFRNGLFQVQNSRQQTFYIPFYIFSIMNSLFQLRPIMTVLFRHCG